MQFSIDLIHERKVRAIQIFRMGPSFLKSGEPVAATFSARPVSSRKRHGFIQEKQFRVTIRRHHRAPPAFEFQEAGYPAPTGVLADNLSIIVV
jgi:hypothetical protein